MKAIFTYPQNFNTDYIDPLYIGDDTVGFQKRIKELKDGDYLAWPGLSPTKTVQELMSTMSKYNNAFEEDTGNNSIYQFWQVPMIELIMRVKYSLTVDEANLVNESGILKLVIDVTDPATSIPSGTRITGEGFTTIEFNSGIASPHDYYLQQYPGNDYKFYITEDAAGLDFSLAFLNDTVYDNRVVISSGGEKLRAFRMDTVATPGCVVKSPASLPDAGITDNILIQLMSNFTTAANGTLDQINTPFYTDFLPGTDFSMKLFTDVGVTEATVTEVILETMTKNYTTVGTHDLGPITPTELINDWGLTQAMQDNLTQVEGVEAGISSGANGWCRVYYSNMGGGTFVSPIDGTEAIPANVLYTGEFYWQQGGATGEIEIFDKRGVGMSYADFELVSGGGPTISVDITVEFIQTYKTDFGYGHWNENITVDRGAAYRNATIDPIVYEIDYANILTYGGSEAVYTYQDNNNQTQPGAVWQDQYYLRNGEGQDFSPTEIKPIQGYIVVDSNGRFTGLTFTPGSFEDRGTFDTNEPKVMKLESAPNTYIPPVPNPAASQDNWDTDDEWTTTGFSALKTWPTIVTPMSASINLKTPSTVNNSQNGIKYTRASGFSKWTLDVEYPPMRAAEFREFHGVAQAANGQATPFYFVLQNADGNSILWKDFYTLGTTQTVRLKESTEIGDTTMLLEGFSSFETSAFQRGEVFIGQQNDNGALHTTVNTVQSNAYGEAKIRTAMPNKESAAIASQIYKNPYWAVVTLSADDFDYSIDTAGFYNMSVSFDLDKFVDDGGV